MKRLLHKAISRLRLTFEQLKKVLIDIENTLNNWNNQDASNIIFSFLY